MNYEKKYKEALERAKDFFKANQIIGKLEENDILSDIFPELKESDDEGIRQEVAGIGKAYRRRYKYIVIENAGDNGTLNCTAEMYYDEGYDLDREKSTDRLLVFVQSEEVKEE